jgi:molecular chaperone GrpE (heat shock protein)
MILQLRRSFSILSRTTGRVSINRLNSNPLFCGMRYCGSAPSKDNPDAPPAEESTKGEAAEKPDEMDEDLEYKQAAEAMSKAETQAKSLHHSLLLKYADAENKRRERVEELKKLDSKHVVAFGNKVSAIFDSLCNVCETAKAKADAPSAGEKVKSLTEGLTMTRDIMRNILVKHNIVKSD